MLDSLTGYAKAHFGLEQGCMFRYQCPAAEANGRAHLEFIEVLHWFRRRHTESGFNAAEAERLVTFIDEWLANHIGRIDVQLKPCVEGSSGTIRPGPAGSRR